MLSRPGPHKSTRLAPARIAEQLGAGCEIEWRDMERDGCELGVTDNNCFYSFRQETGILQAQSPNWSGIIPEYLSVLYPL